MQGMAAMLVTAATRAMEATTAAADTVVVAAGLTGAAAATAGVEGVGAGGATAATDHRVVGEVGVGVGEGVAATAARLTAAMMRGATKAEIMGMATGLRMGAMRGMGMEDRVVRRRQQRGLRVVG
jgi:hypothetical protein